MHLDEGAAMVLNISFVVDILIIVGHADCISGSSATRKAGFRTRAQGEGKMAMLTIKEARKILEENGVTEKLALLGIRGYRGRNRRGIYDDLIAIVSPGGLYTYQANTDPSIQRQGIATLKPGVHQYKRGKHGLKKPDGGYDALRPATPGEELPVTRDGEANPRPGVAINIHRGGYNTTSSEGCQTIEPGEWSGFISKVYALMTLYGQESIPYCLVEWGK